MQNAAPVRVELLGCAGFAILIVDEDDVLGLFDRDDGGPPDALSVSINRNVREASTFLKS